VSWRLGKGVKSGKEVQIGVYGSFLVVHMVFVVGCMTGYEIFIGLWFTSMMKRRTHLFKLPLL